MIITDIHKLLIIQEFIKCFGGQPRLRVEEAGRSGLCVPCCWRPVSPWLHQLGLGSCRQELTLILPRGTEQSRAKTEHQHVVLHVKKLPCDEQVKLMQDKYRETESVNLLNEWGC